MQLVYCMLLYFPTDMALDGIPYRISHYDQDNQTVYIYILTSYAEYLLLQYLQYLRTP